MGRIETMLHHFYKPNTNPDVERAALGDWLDVLAPYSQPAIEAACKTYVQDEKSRPTPAAIRDRAAKYDLRFNTKPYAQPPKALPPKAERIPCTPEEAEKIMAELNFNPNAELLKPMPGTKLKSSAYLTPKEIEERDL